MPDFIREQSSSAKSTGLAVFVFCGLLFSGMFFQGCKNYGTADRIEEGVILYDITYKNNSGRNFPVQLLPKTMEMRFNNHFASYSIEDRVGLFSICNINDLSNRNHITLIKVFDKKYAYKAESNEAPLFFSNSTFAIMQGKDTFRVAGVLSYKANVSSIDLKKNFDIYYTAHPLSKNPNVNTPYEKVDGLLLDFMFELKSLDMHLVAKKIESKQISDDDFSIPEGYKFIPKSKMEEIITTLLP